MHMDDYLQIDTNNNNLENENKKFSKEDLAFILQLIQQANNNVIKESNLSVDKNSNNADKEEKDLPKILGGSYRFKKGSWEGRFYDAEGNQVTRTAKTKKECIQIINNLIKEKEQLVKNSSIKSNITLNEWFEIWIKTYKKPHLKEQSLYTITSKYNKYIKDKLGKKRLKAISQIEWQDLFNSIDKPVSAQKMRSYMKDLYNKAILNKRVIDNPILGIELQKNYTSKTKFIPNKSQLENFLNYISTTRKDLSLLCEFMSLTGCRLGEACALTIKDIDFQNKTININKSLNRYNNLISSTKTKHSNREIPLFPDAERIIKEYIRLFGKNETIFHMVKSVDVTNRVKYYAKKFGLKQLSPHGFRHYFASMCREADIDPKVVQKWMGHKSVLVTLDLYTHVTPNLDSNEANKLGDFLKNGH